MKILYIKSLLKKLGQAGTMLSLLFVFFACDDMEDKLKPQNLITTNDSTSIFVLCEGLFNYNNSTLAAYDLQSHALVTDFFLLNNNRGLGDTGNDMGLYGAKLYVVVTVSSQIEIVDVNTGKSLKQISMFDSGNVARQPRKIAFFNGKAYVCSFDGTVAKIDTASMEIEDVVACGKNPDGICIANNKIYVSNSGGLNHPNYDNTVSIIDISTFTEIKKITVGVNPSVMHADSEGDVYLVSNGNYGSEPAKLQKISSVTDELVSSFDSIPALNFTINNDTAYIYYYDYATQDSWVKVFDCKEDKIISDGFIADGTVLNTPYGIDVNPENGDVYLTDAKSYIVWGDVYCFNNQGKLKFRLNEIGLNPKKVVFQ